MGKERASAYRLPPNGDGDENAVARIPKANDHRPRKAHYYRLSEKDHPTIIEGLKHFASVYHIAIKIGCGYSTLKQYIKKHPELVEVQNEAKVAVEEFVEAQFLRKIAAGELGAMCFYAERKMGWTNRQQIDTNMPLPNIVMGVIPEADIPIGVGEPEKIGEVVKLPPRPEPLDERETEEPVDAEAEAADDFAEGLESDPGEGWDDGDDGMGVGMF